jgi:hypothetical protein
MNNTVNAVSGDKTNNTLRMIEASSPSSRSQRPAASRLLQGTCDRSAYKRGRDQISELPAENSALVLRGCLARTAGSEIRP